MSDTTEPAPPDPPNARDRLRSLGEMVLCSGVPTQLLLAGLFLRLGLGRDPGGVALSLAFVAAVSLTDTVILTGLMLWFLRTGGPAPRALWLGTRPIWGEAMTGLMTSPFILIGVGLLLVGLQHVAPWLHDVPDNPLEAIARGGVIDAALLGVVAIVAGAVREELQRAFLVERFERHLGPTWVGVVVLSVGFGLGHLVQGRDAAIVTGLLGAVWASAYARRRSIVMPLVSHAIFNSLEIIRMLSLP